MIQNLNKHINPLIKYISILLNIILIFLLFNKCSKSITNDKVIIIPPKSNTFIDNGLKPIIKDSIIYKTLKGEVVKIPNPVNLELAKKFELLQKENDTLAMKIAYLEAIGQREYIKNFEDKNINIKITAKTTGTLDSLQVDYKTKIDTIKLLESKFKLYAGSDIHLKGIRFNLLLENKKGNILSTSYDPFNHNIYLGYNIKLFDYKK